MIELLNKIAVVYLVFACVFFKYPPFTYFWETMRMVLISLIYLFTTKYGWVKVKNFWFPTNNQ